VRDKEGYREGEEMPEVFREVFFFFFGKRGKTTEFSDSGGLLRIFKSTHCLLNKYQRRGFIQFGDIN
jgi:hypothetical protein